MCGVAGYLKLKDGPEPDPVILNLMASQLVHRGPDGQGFYVDDTIGLAHTRLSIIDLEGGAQPIHDKDERYWIVFNGEIFNYIELRQELINAGAEFYTHSDTEVILQAFIKYDLDFVNKLNGQFSIAIWDKLDKRLIMVRDRVGIVPLFYQLNKECLFFASEIKSILAATGNRKLNIKALDQLFTFWAPVSPETMFDGVLELSPGHLFEYKNGQIDIKRYWEWSYDNKTEDDFSKVDEKAEELQSLLTDATQIRLRSDVPVGAYLSGGLDSSIITSIIKNNTNTPLRSFSIQFEDKGLDESQHQQLLIDSLKADHSSIKCSYNDIAKNFLDTIWHTEAPILRSAPVPMGMLSGLVNRMGYKVVLTGEGADEVFGGYDIFKESKIRSFWAKNKESVIRPLLLKKLYPYLDVSPGKAQVYLQKFFGVGIDTPDLSYFSHLPRWITTSKIKEFYSESTKESLKSVNSFDSLESYLPDYVKKYNTFHRAQYIESKTLMSGYLLASQGDRMLMKNSVEGRFPFLDHRVIEFGSGLHPKFKMFGLQEKFLLKKSMGALLPNKIVKRYKQPYRSPDIASFINDDELGYVSDLLSEKRVKEYGYFDVNRVKFLLKKIRAGRAIGYKDNMAFMGILSTQALHYLFIERFNDRITV